MYCSGKREIKNNRVCFFHNTTRMHRWRGVGAEKARVSEGMQREREKKHRLALEEFLLLSGEDTCILRSDSSFAFTASQTNGRSKLGLRDRFPRRGYWLTNAEVKFKRKTFNCADRAESC